MTTKTWIAQNALQLTDPSGWTSYGAPAAADTAVQAQGVALLSGYTFPTTLYFGGADTDPPTLNIIGGGQLNLVFGTNVTPDGHAAGKININYGGTANIAMKTGPNESGFLTENISYRGISGGMLTMQAAPKGSLNFMVNGFASNGAAYTHLGNTVVGEDDIVTLNAATVGAGSWNVGFLGTLSITQTLSQSVTNSGGSVNLQDVAGFTGTLQMQAASGEVSLGSIAADDATLQSGVLTLLDKGITQAALHVSGTNYNVWETNTGVQLGGLNYTPTGSNNQLLLHV
jgi:hypothetical protein